MSINVNIRNSLPSSFVPVEKETKEIISKSPKVDLPEKPSLSVKSIKEAVETKGKFESLLEDIDDKRLGFFHGDTFLSASGLEGGDVTKNLKFLLPCIEASGLFTEKKQVIDLFKECVSREEKMKPFFNPEAKESFEIFFKQANRYAEFLCKKVENLQGGERFLMSGGWASLDRGHAMFYIVEKGKNGKFIFSVVNSGAGIDNHQAQEKELKTKYKPVLRLYDIDENLMVDKKFFLALQELGVTLDPKDGITPWKHSQTDIYDRIIPALQGKRDLEFEEKLDFITYQRSGTCSWMSIMKLLHIEADDIKDYKSFNFALRRDSLKVYFNKLRNGKLPLNGMRLELLKRCTENFSQNSLKQDKSDVISKEELEVAEKLIQDIQRQIEIWESSSPVKNVNIDLENTTQQEGTVLNKEIFTVHEADPSIVSQKKLSLALTTDQSLKKMPETLDQFQKELGSLTDRCEKLSKIEEYRDSIVEILLFVTSMNSWEKSIDTWIKEENKEKIEATMDSILTLSRLLVSNIAGLPEKERGSPEQFALMTILTALNAKLGEKIEFRLDDDFLSKFNDSPYFILLDAKLRLQYYAASSLLKDQRNKNKICLKLFKYNDYNGQVLLLSPTKDLKKILKDPEFLEKIANINPEYLSKSDNEKLVFAFSRWGTKDCPFPKQYQILNEMGLLMDYFLQNPLLQILEPKEMANVGKLRISVTQMNEIISLKPLISGRIKSFENQSCYLDSKQLEKQNLFSEEAGKIRKQELKELIEMEWTACLERRGFSTSHDDLINWNAKSNLAVTLKAKPSMSRQNTQQLAYILSNETTKIPNLIAYFQENPEYLGEVDNQLFLIYQLFSRQVLHEIIINKPLILDKIFSFIEEQYALQKGLGNIQQQLFFLSFADCLKDLVKESNPKTEIKLKLDIRKEFLQVVSKVVDNTLEGKRLKALAYQHYIASFNKEENLTEENCKEFSKGFAYVTAFGFDINLSYPRSVENMYAVIGRVNKKVETSDDSFHKNLLQDISKDVLGCNDVQWQGTYPHFSDLSSSYKIVLNPMTIFVDDKIVGALPQEFIRHPYFQKVIGDKPFLATSAKNGEFELKCISKDIDQPKFRLFFSKNDHSLKILKQINNGWYTYIPHTELDGKLRPASLIQGHLHWMLKKNLCAEILVESEKEKKIESVLKLFYHWDSFRVTKWSRLDSGAVLQNIYSSNNPLSLHLNDFQPIDSISLWKDDKIEFSSLGIHFKIDKEKLVYSKNSDFILSKLQQPPKQLPHFSGYLEMEGKNHEKKYLIPKGTVNFFPVNSIIQEGRQYSSGKNVIKFEPGCGSLLKNFKIQPDLGNSASYYELSEKDGKLVGKNPEENLYIAYLHLAHKNYDAANELLKQNLVGRPKGYSEREAELIDLLANFTKKSLDHSPPALALAVKILYLQMRNTNKINESCLSIFDQFYPVSKHVKQFFLSPDEEIELLQYIREEFSLSTSSQQRLKQLKGEFVVSGRNITSENKQGTFIPPVLAEIIDSSTFLDIPKNYDLSAHTSFKDGKKYFDKQMEFIFKDISSEDLEKRKMAISHLTLLDLKEHPQRSRIRDLMIVFALQADSDNRSNLNSKPTLEDFIQIVKSINKKPFLRTDKKVNNKINQPKKVLKAAKERKKPQLKIDHPIKVPDIKTILEKYQIELQEVSEQNLQDSSGLLKMLSVPKGISKIEESEYLRLQESVKADAQEQAINKSYVFKEGQIEQLHNAFEKEISDYTTKLEDQKKKILNLANKLPADHDAAVRWQLKLAGKKKKGFTIDDLIILFLQNNGEALVKRNPNLSNENIHELVNLLANYLVDSTEANHLKELEKKTAEVIKENGKQTDLNALLREKRSYKPAKEPAMLVFEHYKGIRLRERNVKTIRSMILGENKECKNIVNQLNMGSGKTKVILPLLAFLNSRGDNIPIILAPDQLFETNLEDMRALSGEILNQESETIKIKKDAPLTTADMKEILMKFDRVKKRRSYCLVNQTTINVLYLHYKEIVTNLPNDKERFELIKQIMNTLAKEGDLIIDEVDMVLDCLKEMNFSKGAWKNVDEITQTALSNTFLELVKNPLLHEFFKMDKESEKAFDEQKYEKEIKPLLAKMFIKMVGWKENEILENYLLSKKEVDKIPKVVLEADEAVKAQLALGKELIKSLFPLVMSKNCHEHFGLSQTEKSNKAIPYARSNTPSEGSEFGTPIETLIYTLLYFARKGVDERQLKQLVDECKASALAEYQSEGTPLNQTQGYKKFALLNLVEGKDLFSIQESEYKNAAQVFNEEYENKLRFAKLYGWSEVGIYPGRLSSNPQNLVGLFRSVQGFTGTLWNKDTYHKSLNPVPKIELDGKTLNILYRSNPKITPYSKDLNNFFSSLGDYNACIDVGAWFRGMSCLKVATTMLDNLPKTMKGIVYINDVDTPKSSIGQPVILERGSKTPQLLSKSNLSELERFTYYNVTTGADITQHASAKAIVTISKTVALRDLSQGVWRMRGLDNKQRVDFAIPEELCKPDLESILGLVISNQARRPKDDNLRSLRQQMDQLVEHTVNKVLLSSEVNADDASKIAQDVKEIFIHMSEENLFKLFGGIESKIEIKGIVKPMLKQAKANAIKLYKKHPQFKKTLPLETLKSDLKKLINYNLLPEEDYHKNDFNYGLQMQVRKEVQLEQNSKKETQINLEAIDDKVDLDRKAGIPRIWRDDNVVDLFTPSFPFYETESVNDYLNRHSKQFVECYSLFSSNFKLSGNFTCLETDNKLEKTIVPFQSGSKPGGVSALHVNENGRLNLIFLHPSEAELISDILDMEKKVDYEKFSKFTQEKFINFIVEESKAYFKKELESGRIKEKIRKFLLEEKFDEQWVIEVVSNNKFDQAWIKKFIDELSDSWAKDEMNIIVDVLEMMEGENLRRYISEDHWCGNNKNKIYSPDDLMEQIIRGRFPEFSVHMEKRLLTELGLEKIEHKNEKRLCASQLHQLFSSKKKNVLLLVHPFLGVIESGTTDIKKLQLESNPEYVKLMTEAKFYMGVLNGYKPEEKAYLTSWIKEKGAAEIENFFLKNILSVRASSKRKYPTSALKKIIDSVAK